LNRFLRPHGKYSVTPGAHAVFLIAAGTGSAGRVIPPRIPMRSNARNPSPPAALAS